MLNQKRDRPDSLEQSETDSEEETVDSEEEGDSPEEEEDELEAGVKREYEVARREKWLAHVVSGVESYLYDKPVLAGLLDSFQSLMSDDKRLLDPIVELEEWLLENDSLSMMLRPENEKESKEAKQEWDELLATKSDAAAKLKEILVKLRNGIAGIITEGVAQPEMKSFEYRPEALARMSNGLATTIMATWADEYSHYSSWITTDRDYYFRDYTLNSNPVGAEFTQKDHLSWLKESALAAPPPELSPRKNTKQKKDPFLFDGIAKRYGSNWKSDDVDPTATIYEAKEDQFNREFHTWLIASKDVDIIVLIGEEVQGKDKKRDNQLRDAMEWIKRKREMTGGSTCYLTLGMLSEYVKWAEAKKILLPSSVRALSVMYHGGPSGEAYEDTANNNFLEYRDTFVNFAELLVRDSLPMDEDTEVPFFRVNDRTCAGASLTKKGKEIVSAAKEKPKAGEENVRALALGKPGTNEKPGQKQWEAGHTLFAAPGSPLAKEIDHNTVEENLINTMLPPLKRRGIELDMKAYIKVYSPRAGTTTPEYRSPKDAEQPKGTHAVRHRFK